MITKGYIWGSLGLFYLFQISFFILLTALLGKKWCGWICPFGLFQDWVGLLRKKLGIRAGSLSAKTIGRLSWIKYALLIIMFLVSSLISLGLVHPDLANFFCQICPGARILPLFVWDTQYVSLDVTNKVTLAMTLSSLIITGGLLAGMFFRDRFFCLFCPMAALINLVRPITAVRLFKEPRLCQGCASCRRACPMDIEKVHQELTKTKVQTRECLNCGRCLGACASDGCLGFSFFGKKYLASSRRLALGVKKRS
jgi:polyferredoxin